MSRSAAEPPRPLRQGSAAKRTAIARAAVDVFVRYGYTRTSVDVIAAEAGVSKRTIYDYYGDKRRLFLSVMEEMAEAEVEIFQELLRRSLDGTESIEQALVRLARAVATAVARSPQRSAVLRLLIGEAAHFPELLRRWRPMVVVQRSLAARLADYADRGLLDVADPLEAAEHFGLLVTGSVNNRSVFGTVHVPDEEVDALAVSGVQVFLRAYRATRDQPPARLAPAARAPRTAGPDAAGTATGLLPGAGTGD